MQNPDWQPATFAQPGKIEPEYDVGAVELIVPGLTPEQAEKTQQAREQDQVHELAKSEALRLEVKDVAQKAYEEKLGAKRRIVVTSGETIEDDNHEWLWEGRIPLGEITMIVGKGGIGKSQVLAMFAAWLSKGEMKGHFFGEPKNILYVVNEDDINRTVIPRMKAAGADVSRVKFIGVENDEGGELRLDLTRDLEDIEATAREYDAAAVFFDPLSSNLNVKSISGDEMRPLLEGVRKMAARCRVAIVGLGHVRKGHSKDLLEALMGSSEIGNVIRSAMGVMRDVDDEEGAVVLSQEKNNNGEHDIHGYKYRIVRHEYVNACGKTITTSRLQWIGKTDMKVGEMMADMDRMGEGKSKVKEAADFLVAYLSDPKHGGQAPKKEIVTAARGEGIASSTLDRAAARLKVQSSRSGFGAGALWSLPGGS